MSPSTPLKPIGFFPTKKSFKWCHHLHSLHPFPAAPSPKHFFLVLVVPTPRQQLLYRFFWRVSCHLPLRTSSLGKMDFWNGMRFLAGKKTMSILVESRKLREILNVIDSIWRNVWLELASFAINTTWVFQSSDLWSILLSHSNMAP